MNAFHKTYLIIKKLDPIGRANIIKPQLLVFISSLTETGSLILVAPIIAAISGNHTIITKIADYTNLLFLSSLSNNEMLTILSALYIVLTVAASLIGMQSVSMLSRYASFIATEAATKLLKQELTNDFMVFCKRPQSYHINFIITEVSRFADNVLQPIAQINSRIVSGMMILILLFLLSPVIAFSSLMLFSASYFVMYKIVRKRLRVNGEALAKESHLRTSYAKDSLKSIKEVITYRIEDYFISRFSSSSSRYYGAYANLNILYNVPRFIVELLIYLSFGVMVFLVSIEYIVITNESLGYVAVFGLASIKMLPIFQQTYSSIARIKGSADVVDRIYDELTTGSTAAYKASSHHLITNLQFASKLRYNSMRLDNLSFCYPDSSSYAIKYLSFNFPSTGRIAIVGPSGSGKSTLMDIVVGLLKPTSGSFDISYLDGTCKLVKLPSLFNVGFVPQEPVMIQGSILNNISLDFSNDAIVVDRVLQCLEDVGLTDYINGLPDGILYNMSSDNFGISGGQRQRIAIARALFRQAAVLVLDEPTSALDTESERVVIDLLRNLSKKILVITIAHRLNTIIDYDCVLFMKNGELVASGPYEILFKDFAPFREFVSSGV